MSALGHKVLSLDKAARGETRWLPCCWDDCEHPGTTLHVAMYHDHARGWTCDHPEAKHLQYVFCSDRHLQYFAASHRGYGQLPAGMRNMIT